MDMELLQELLDMRDLEDMESTERVDKMNQIDTQIIKLAEVIKRLNRTYDELKEAED